MGVYDNKAAPTPDGDDNLYMILGVSILASSEEIKTAFKKKALECHPDRNMDDFNANEKFIALQEAYHTLIDRSTRAEYDKGLLHKLFVEEYLGRFADLILTASGLELELEKDYYCNRQPAFPAYLDWEWQHIAV